MSIDRAKEIAQFIKNNDVVSINLMGGEFFCNPDWYEIFTILIDSCKHARIVSNGDWANNISVQAKLQRLVINCGDKINISISRDKWHTNKNVDKAGELLEKMGAKYNIPDINYLSESGIVPIGRSAFSSNGIYSFFGCYCQKPESLYTFLIDEDGDIYKCDMGVLQYANISDYLDGGFDKRFKEFNMKFYNAFIPNCAKCYQTMMFKNNKDRKLLVRTD